MDERCKNCQSLCKQLDPEDMPVRYEFSNLTPELVITEIEAEVHRFSHWHHLEVEQSEKSFGGQLAILLNVQYKQSDEDNCLVFIAQAETRNGKTELYIRYGVPPGCCQEPAARGFSTMTAEVLQSLEKTDWLLEKAARRS